MKIVLSDVLSGHNVSKLNDNFQKIADALNSEVLYRDNPLGEPNMMYQNLDMDGHDILNVGQIDLTKVTLDGVDLIAKAADAQAAATAAEASASAAAISESNALLYANQSSAGQVNSDWNSTDTSFPQTILNKPNLSLYALADFSNITGTLPVTKGGTGVTTLTGVVKANGTGAYSAATAGDIHAALGYTPYNSTNPSGFAVGNQAVNTTSNVTFNSVSAGVVTETSDERLKHDWKPLTDEQLSALANMKLVGTFAWADGTRSVGGSAQEIQKIVPEAVYEDAEGKLRVAYGGLNFAILQAILRL